MTVINLILCLALSLGIAEMPVGAQSAARISDNRQRQPDLHLSTSIVSERYSLERGFRILRWTLKLTYTNAGAQPIMLDRKSTLIFRVMVSKSSKGASEGRYNYDESYYIPNPSEAGMRLGSAPEEDAFVTLNAGESYTVMKDSRVNLRDGTKNSKGDLGAGSYFLRVRIATWYYWADPELYGERWRDKGYLWSKDITSDPMPFTVQKTPTFEQ